MNCYDRSLAIQLGNDAFAALQARSSCGSCGGCGSFGGCGCGGCGSCGCQPSCVNPCGTSGTVFISGTATDATGAPVAGLPIAYVAGGVSAVTHTDATGTYTIPVSNGVMVTLTPQVGLGVTVMPPSRTMGPVCADQPGQDFGLSSLTPPGDITLSGLLTGLPSAAGQTVTYSINGAAATTTTDATGRYTLTAPRGSNVVITPPVVAGLTPAPLNYTFNNLTGPNNNALNFAYSGPGVTFTFQGALVGLPIVGGVPVHYTINGVPGTTVTDLSGNYRITVPRGAALTVFTASQAGFTVSPQNYPVANMNQNISNQNFIFSPENLTVSGTLTGPFPAGALVRATIIQHNGPVIERSLPVDAGGNYLLAVRGGDTVILTPPAGPGLSVSPSSYVLPGITANQTGQNFAYAASTGTNTISGAVANAQGPVSGAEVLFAINNVPGGTLTTDSLGRYSLQAPNGATVDLELAVQPGESPVPIGRTLTNVTGDQPGQNFLLVTQAPGFWPVSGRLIGLANPANLTVSAQVNGTQRIATTNQQGQFTFSVPNGGTISITPPVLPGNNVTPLMHLIPSVTQSMTGQNFLYTSLTAPAPAATSRVAARARR